VQVVLDDVQRGFHVQPCKCVQRFAQRPSGQFRGQPQLRGRQRTRHATVNDGLDHARNARGFVAGTLQVGRGFGHANQQAQIAGGGLPSPDHRRNFAVDLNLHAIDLVFEHQHLVGGFWAEVLQGVDGLVQLRFDHAPHLHHQGGDLAQFHIKLAGEVFFWHINQTFR